MEQPGSAYDPTLFEFTTDVSNDQSKEIELMHGLLLGSQMTREPVSQPVFTMPKKQSGISGR